MTYPLEELIGRTIDKLETADYNSCIRFWTHQDSSDYQVLSYYCFGDCCSISWINHISGLSALLGTTVVGFQLSTDHEQVDATKQESEYRDVYTLITNKGRFDIEFRNSSNGYYGGSLYKMSDDTREWIGNIAPNGHWKEITEDF